MVHKQLLKGEKFPKLCCKSKCPQSSMKKKAGTGKVCVKLRRKRSAPSNLSWFSIAVMLLNLTPKCVHTCPYRFTQQGPKRRLSSTAQLLLLIQNNTRGFETKESKRNQEGEGNNFSSLLYTQQQLSCVYFGVMENVFSVLYWFAMWICMPACAGLFWIIKKYWSYCT